MRYSLSRNIDVHRNSYREKAVKLTTPWRRTILGEREFKFMKKRLDFMVE